MAVGYTKQELVGRNKYLRTKDEKNVSFSDEEMVGRNKYLREKSSEMVTPTVLSDQNVRDRVIPNLKDRAGNLPVYPDVPEEPEDTQVTVNDFFGTKPQTEEEDPYTKQIYELFDKMGNTSDMYTRETIRNIRDKYDRLESEQRSSTGANLGAVRMALSRAGGRYNPQGSALVTGGVSAQGIKVLADLDSEERQAVAEARQAQLDNDYRLLQEKLDVVKSIRDEKAKAAESVDGELKQASRDNALAAKVAQGITDPIELLTQLNSEGGDFTIEEVTSALKNLDTMSGSGLYKLDNKATGLMLGAGWTAPDIQAFQKDLESGASVDKILAGITDPGMKQAALSALGVDKAEAGIDNLVPGAGAQDSMSEYVIRQQLFTTLKNQIYGKNSSDKEASSLTSMIANLRDLGMEPQKVIDTLTGFAPGVETPYNSQFANIIRANSDDPAKVKNVLVNLSSILASGDYKKAMNLVENESMKNAQKLDPDGYIGDNTTRTMLENVRDLRDALAVSESYVGPISGSLQKVYGLLKSKGPEATKLQAKIANLVAEFRNRLSGTAVTDSEKAFLEPLIADISDTAPNIKVKLSELERSTLNKYNKTRNNVSLPTLSVREALYPAHRLKLYVTEEEFDGSNAPQI